MTETIVGITGDRPETNGAGLPIGRVRVLAMKLKLRRSKIARCPPPEKLAKFVLKASPLARLSSKSITRAGGNRRMLEPEYIGHIPSVIRVVRDEDGYFYILSTDAAT